MVRPPSFDSNGMKKGAWSEEEDKKLRDYVMRYGHWNWRLLPKYAGLARCGKSCRLRWVNYLKPGVKRGNFGKEEEDLIIKLQAQLGNKWSAIAAKLPGRTDNEIKNFYHTRIEKHGKRNRNKATAHTNEDSSKNQAMEEERASEIAICQKTQDESASPEEQSVPSPPPIAQSQVDSWPDMFQTDANYSQIDCFPPLIEEELYYSQLQYSELSSSDSLYISAPDWIADDDHSIIYPRFVAPLIQGSVWNESSASNSMNSQSESSYTDQSQEVGGLYDPFIDYGVSLFS